MSEEQPKCPVDHSAREVWLKQGGANPHEDIKSKPRPQVSNESDKCPIDHEARAKWVEIGKQQEKPKPTPIQKQNFIQHDVEITSNTNHSSENLSNDPPIYLTNTPLPEDREISSIPRTGADANWIYPSQKQFFEAMKRKNWDPNASDMGTVVPIHNAVNERAWYHILKWEEGQGSDECGGVKLTSFKGDSKALTPKARLKLLLGYSKPFDRHDWTINRCGKEIDYVIDFYTGKTNALNPGMASFYLDVRPKLNSFEGVKLRVLKFFGL
ncbi:Cytochrome c-type heme lyase [Wickerhamomyces ciferrii]|uniref:Holocytochrome c-type synthase n=1 Tax=Wickerhamomyces ciferrii (strain ATCC 14091 / BCRC 22168 / CBS 111 / JCM 3599 / NBRC 0793 / NRRL Y-1031 F-60-10) TaxID=1206466 RepID=K0KHV4_WICCF|nr:Cytochrome c-type heme lyase [Wickerhamomyces ciferrii]CCH40738.1 Cytochrome c-type heme lyase [Wickerhamomyces ciferrii]